MKLFGTFGIRGVANQDLIPELAFKVSSCFCNLYRGPIMVGRDARTSSDMLFHSVVAGLISVGCKAIDLGLIPTPGLQYAIRNSSARGGVMITASHNPPEYNGIKFLDENGIGIPKENEKKIEEMFFSDNIPRKSWDCLGKLERDDSFIEKYKLAIISRIDKNLTRKKGLKVVIDCANNVGSLVTPYVLKELGCKVITINSQLDGHFPGRDPEPTVDSLRDLGKAVIDTEALIGIAHDGDADRTIFLDENGNVLTGDRNLGIIAKEELIKKGKGIVVTTVGTSSLIDFVVNEYNGDIIRTKIGDTNVSRKLKECNGLIGGEENGGVIFPDLVWGRDGALTAAKMVEILCKYEKTLSEINKELPMYYSCKLKTRCPEYLKNEVMAKFENVVPEYDSLDKTDGVKVIFSDGSWVLVRASGTEPIIRIFSESRDEKKAKKLAYEHADMVKELVSEFGESNN
ncbi:MAG: phosphoglucosamine mutase [Candidatus Hydrothermarchaeota archaeon]